MAFVTAGNPGRRRLPVVYVVVLIVLWVAFALRVAHLDRQSIWYDEGLSIYYARADVGQLLSAISQSEHPPLHSLLLHAWMSVCGDSEFSVRLLSVWFGVLSVALLYHLGRRLSPATGALAATLLGVSPFAIWFSQETRGYVLALAAVIATVEVALDLYPPLPGRSVPPPVPRASRYVAYIALTAASLYAHVYSAFALLALNLAYFVDLARYGRYVDRSRLRTHVLRWMAAQVAVLILFAPWLPYVATQLDVNATYWHGGLGWRQIVRRTLTAFSVGNTLSGPWAVAATIALSLLALLGSFALFRRRDSRPSPLLLWLWILVPLLFQIALTRDRPKFAPRYLIGALPAFLTLASAGGCWLYGAARENAFRARGWAATAVLLLTTAAVGGATARSLGNLYFDERYSRPDYRAAARYIEEHATESDLIVLVGGHSYPAFTYYYRGPLPVVPLPEDLLPTTREPIDLRSLETLNQAIAGRRQLWLLLWQPFLSDPTGLITDELEQTYHRLGVGRTFHELGLLLFDVSPGPMLAESTTPQTPMRAVFDGKVQLLGYDLPASEVRPGDTPYLYLYWESLGDIPHDYKVFTQVLDDSGHIVAQHDKIAGAESYPSSHWPPAAVVRDRFMLTVHPDTPPGRYPLIVGLYRPSKGLPRLPVKGEGANGDHVILTDIVVESK
jgi:4-amino-4-deoxy-L-arabinose transferase-like glycosyltransferase